MFFVEPFDGDIFSKYSMPVFYADYFGIRFKRE